MMCAGRLIRPEYVMGLSQVTQRGGVSVISPAILSMGDITRTRYICLSVTRHCELRPLGPATEVQGSTTGDRLCRVADHWRLDQRRPRGPYHRQKINQRPPTAG